METEPILVKSTISKSTIFIIIAVFLCIGVIIFIIINNKSKTPDCKNKCNNADDGVGGKCTKICDVGMKCVDKTCVCAPDCSDNTKCDDGCGGTCPCAGGSVCFEKKCCKPKCSNKCKGDSDDCGGTCDGPCTDIIARPVNQASTCAPPPSGVTKGNVGFAAGYWGHHTGLCGTPAVVGPPIGYPANCGTEEDKIQHGKDIIYNDITIDKTIDQAENWLNYCYKKCPTGYESYSVEDKALFCKKK